MPRKKTVQPPPLETFTLDDGTPVEIRDGKCLEIGRGLHNRNAYLVKRDKVLELVANDYLTPNGRKYIPTEKDYLSSATKFAKQVEAWGIHGKDGEDDSSLRKNWYRDIKANIKALANAIENKRKA